MLRTIGRRWLSVPATTYAPTIYALSTPMGQKSAIAVVRVSGTHARLVYEKLTDSKRPPTPRRASLRNLYSPQSAPEKVFLDSALTLFFEQPGTFTGEDILELHVHGGKAVVAGVLDAIGALHDESAGVQIRYAEAGEFSRRAFQNGRFDLTEIEGIGELIDAETETQRRSAISSFRGQNRLLFAGWRQQIVDNIAQVAAIIDFGDDTEIQDIDAILEGVRCSVKALRREVADFVERVTRSTILQSGIRLSVLGAPNAGKSSLVNCITKDDTSIVSSIPGTTRDAIDVPLDINGYKVILTDTAGVRAHSTDPIELIGIARAQERTARSDIVLLVVDATAATPLSPALRSHLRDLTDKCRLVVINKSDLVPPSRLKYIQTQLAAELPDCGPALVISCKQRDGLDALVHALTSHFTDLASCAAADPIAISARARDILRQDVLAGLDGFLRLASSAEVDVASESLRSAADGIGTITGDAVGVEEVLGVVFSNFCVGK
ncbi:ABR063Cp [Eremothecium gossypii ATCC 10895]|uniref:ABR063Cp n=1 Tax=Eremothecium gossypii (strain ATCC 10895 / CBS 109.51 / FGSC 9923 / NRRL Y-1056) TaxID=284811 RepID=Q75DG3_EREGS|nr:ABR063Cp [Eremothecium gossypii ATCC 10895]AAS50833.3 ABR063Cp [Eremothecium gossypii ATCC 10895]AEY95122.1 FABR063Cp [Eremothecium gossypii FDAG1]